MNFILKSYFENLYVVEFHGNSLKGASLLLETTTQLNTVNNDKQEASELFLGSWDEQKYKRKKQ